MAGSENKTHDIRPGDWVEIDGMGGIGQVIEINREKARVMLYDKEWLFSLGKLCAVKEPGEAKPRGRVHVSTRNSLKHEIDLHGMRVEDALEAVRQGIDQAIVYRLSQFKIIHGHGSGRIRTAVRDLLAQHPHVESFRFAEPWEGGMGGTVVRLKTSITE